MRKEISRFWLFTKRNFKKPSYYLILILAILFLVLTLDILTGDEAMVSYGVVNENSELAAEVIGHLQSQKHSYEMVVYHDISDMEAAVAAGILDCGFVFREELDEIQGIADLENTVDYITATSTLSGPLIREMVFASMLQTAAKRELQTLSADGSTFQESSTELTEELIREYEALLTSEDVLQVQIEAVEPGQSEAAIGKRGQESDPVKAKIPAVFAVIIFAGALCLGKSSFEQDNIRISRAVGKKERIWIRFQILFSAVLPMACVMGVFVWIRYGEYIAPNQLCLRVLYSSAISAVWVLFYSSFFKKEERYFGSILGVLVLSILTCPALFSADAILPGLSLVRWMFPMNWIV